VFGGLAASRGDSVQFSLGSAGNLSGQGAASGVFRGGLSGVAFAGQPPNLQNLPKGCAYQERCAYVMDRCCVSRPSLFGFDDGRASACFREDGQ